MTKQYCFHGQPHGNENPICREINQWCEILWKVCNNIDEPHCETQKLCRMLARFRHNWSPKTMDTDETSNAFMDNHMVMKLQFVGKRINYTWYLEKYAIISMSLIVRHKNCVECQQDLGNMIIENNGHWRNKHCIHGQPHDNVTPFCRKINQWCEIPWKVCNSIDELHCETQNLCRMLARFRDTWWSK